MLERYAKMLNELAANNQRRSLSTQTGIDFSSNDFLALTAAPEMRSALVEAINDGLEIGSGGSRLLRGNHPEIEALEAEACEHFNAEAALFMASGYLANFAILTTLPQRNDCVFHDALIHASSHEGMRAGRAEHRPFPHNDPAALKTAIDRWRAEGGTGTPWVAIESLYSMDGDRAPIDEIVVIAEQHDAMLLIDEAHATGVFGKHGRGLAEHLESADNVVTVHTCGKALGSSGALITCSDMLREFLINRCRSFIYTTAPSPLTARAVRTALALCRTQPDRRERLSSLIDHTNAALSRLGVQPSGSQIIPVIVGDNAAAMQLAGKLQSAGFDIRGIRPPTVPEGTARLRISLTLHATPADVDRMVDVLAAEAPRIAA